MDIVVSFFPFVAFVLNHVKQSSGDFSGNVCSCMFYVGLLIFFISVTCCWLLSVLCELDSSAKVLTFEAWTDVLYCISFVKRILYRTMALPKALAKYSKDSSHTVYVCPFDSPVGKVTAAADDDYLYMVSLEDSKNFEKMLQTISEELFCTFIEKKNKILEQLDNELKDYFAGKLKTFTVPIKTFGSEFQKQVWEKLQELPYGSTQTYGDLAKSLGRAPSHSRAVGAACGANAHLLVIPCHRLVASGSKGGFSCGVNRKEWLLDHEQKHST